MATAEGTDVIPTEEESDEPTIDDKGSFAIGIINAIITRAVFALHFAIHFYFYRRDTHGSWYSFFAILVDVGIGLMVIEGIYAIIVRKAKGYKWISPCIAIYLGVIIPLMWAEHLHLFHTSEKEAGKHSEESSTKMARAKSRGWVNYSEQFLMYNLIIGKWLLPKGGMEREEVTRLLITYIGMSADIIGLFESFTNIKVTSRLNLVVTILILLCVSVSLVQFALVVAAPKDKKRAQYTEYGEYNAIEREDVACCKALEGTYICDQEVVACMIVTFMQDLPFLILRIAMCIMYSLKGHMHTFFLGKNALVLVIVVYKLFGVFIDRGKKKDYDEIDD